MIATEFLKMMREDNETHADADQMREVIEVMAAVLSPIPSAEIDGSKTAEACYSFMRDYAKKHQKGSSYVMGTQNAMEVVSEYLGVTLSAAEPIKPTPLTMVNFDDLLD